MHCFDLGCLFRFRVVTFISAVQNHSAINDSILENISIFAYYSLWKHSGNFPNINEIEKNVLFHDQLHEIGYLCKWHTILVGI